MGGDMADFKDVKRRLWLKFTIIFLVAYGIVTIGFRIIHRATHMPIFYVWLPIIFGVVASLFLPVIYRLFGYSKEKTRDSYVKLDNYFEKSSMDLISTCLGSGVVEKLFLEDLNFVVVNGIELCSELLNNNITQENVDLRFVILLKKAEFYFKDGRYDSAIDIIKEALQIKPEHTVANLRAAELYERAGKGADAVVHYERAASSGTALPDGLIDYINAQIKRINTEGPRRRKPPSGAKWMTG